MSVSEARLTRVALVARGRNIAGGEVSLQSLAGALPGRYVPTFWLCEEGELAEVALRKGFPVHSGSWDLLRRERPWPFLRLVANIMAGYRRLGIGLVHVNSPMEAAAYILSARLMSIPVVVHVRTYHPRSFLIRQLLGLADAAIFNSASLRSEVGWPSGRVVHNGVDLPQSMGADRRRALRAEMGAGPDDLLLGQLGQVIHMKGVDLTLQAFARLRAQGMPARLAIIGEDHQTDGRYRQEMQVQAQSLGIADEVRFLGYRQDSPAIMASLDMLLCPSREEPFGRVLIEAMACGVPPIAAAVGGIPEVVRHGQDGLLVPSDDAVALARAIRRLAADEGLVRRMSASGVDRAHRHFSSEVHARQIVHLYDEFCFLHGEAGAGELPS